jgi:hypothetical protein
MKRFSNSPRGQTYCYFTLLSSAGTGSSDSLWITETEENKQGYQLIQLAHRRRRDCLGSTKKDIAAWRLPFDVEMPIV